MSRNPALLLLVVLAPFSRAAEPARFRLSLAEAERSVLERSDALRAAKAEAEAASERARAQRAGLWPRLYLEGSLHWQSRVAVLPPLAPGVPAVELGAHRGSSIGPSLYWTLLDFGALSKAASSAGAAERSARAEAERVERQTRLAARRGYFEVQLGLERTRLLSESVALAASQHEDIRKRAETGAASAVDALAAHRDLLRRQAGLRRARAELASGLRGLMSLCGLGEGLDESLPLDPASAAAPPAGAEPASLVVELDGQQDSLAALEPLSAGGPDLEHPALRSSLELARSWREAAAGSRSGRWPRVQLSARASYDYPNGASLKSVQQNQLGLTASLPLFDPARTDAEGAEREAKARAQEGWKGRAETELKRDFRQAQDRAAGLRALRVLQAQAAAETEELARKRYRSYQEGRSSLLEVQAANLEALEAKTDAASSSTELLLELALLAELGKP